MEGISFIEKNGINQIVITKEAFDILKKDDKFASVVNLGRLFNALMSSLDDYLHYKDNKTPRETRQKWATFIASLGYLHEGINLFKRIEKDYSTDSMFKNTIGKLLKTRNIEEFNRFLASIRSATAFHFYDNVTKKVLNGLNFEEYIFASGETENFGDMHFELSDNVNLNFWTYGLKTPEEENARLEHLFTKSSNLINKTCDCIQKFIGLYIDKLMNPIKKRKKPRTSKRIRQRRK